MLGLSTVFLFLGFTASAFGQFFLQNQTYFNIIAGLLVMLFGLHFLGIYRIGFLNQEARIDAGDKGGSALGAYVLGLAFAFGWTPCIGPILGAILTVSASTANAWSGMALLGVYSLGLGVPFMLSALSLDRFIKHQKFLRRWGHFIHIAAGLIMILMGSLMITGKLSELSYWLLRTFPALGVIG